MAKRYNKVYMVEMEVESESRKIQLKLVVAEKGICVDRYLPSLKANVRLRFSKNLGSPVTVVSMQKRC